MLDYGEVNIFSGRLGAALTQEGSYKFSAIEL